MSEPDAYDRLYKLLGTVPDGRGRQGRLHALPDVLFIMLVGVICGQEDAEAIEDFAEENESWFRQRCSLPHGIPSQDTFLRVLASMKPEAFEAAFLAWVAELWPATATGERHIAIDGKTLRRSFDRASGQSPLHSVAAFVSDTGLVIGSTAVEAKENEIVAIPKLLSLIDVKGATVTIDAMGCQRTIAQAIHDAGGYYLLQVKANHPKISKQINGFFKDSDRVGRPVDDPAPDVDHAEALEKGHGRLETRSCDLSRDLSWIDTDESWPGLSAIVRVSRSTTELSTGQSRAETRYFISNHPKLSAEAAAALVRRHWAIENNLHWVLDVALDEDQSRVRTKNAARNLATVRRAALNLVASAPSPKKGVSKISITRRRRIAAMNEGYRELILGISSAYQPT